MSTDPISSALPSLASTPAAPAATDLKPGDPGYFSAKLRRPVPTIGSCIMFNRHMDAIKARAEAAVNVAARTMQETGVLPETVIDGRALSQEIMELAAQDAIMQERLGMGTTEPAVQK